MNTETKEVNFYKYCPLCEHRDKADADDPCNECLENPSNVNSRKPVMFKEREKGSRRNDDTSL